MAEKPLSDDEIKQVRVLLKSFDYCEQCEAMKPELVDSRRYGDDGYYDCMVCNSCNESNKAND